MQRKKHRKPASLYTMVPVHPQSKGMSFRKIIKQVVIGNREYLLHATKGWRSNRV